MGITRAGELPSIGVVRPDTLGALGRGQTSARKRAGSSSTAEPRSSSFGASPTARSAEREGEEFHDRRRVATDFAAIAHPAVSASDRDVLNAIARSLATVEPRWSRLEDICARMPHTLVHGDFVPKNVRVRKRRGRLDLVAFDWETAGVAPPAVDLALLDATDADLRRYLAIVRDVWPALRIRDLRQLSRVGNLFWLLHALYWAGRSFAHDWVQHAMWDLIEYDRDLRIALLATGRSARARG